MDHSNTLMYRVCNKVIESNRLCTNCIFKLVSNQLNVKCPRYYYYAPLPGRGHLDIMRNCPCFRNGFQMIIGELLEVWL